MREYPRLLLCSKTADADRGAFSWFGWLPDFCSNILYLFKADPNGPSRRRRGRVTVLSLALWPDHASSPSAGAQTRKSGSDEDSLR